MTIEAKVKEDVKTIIDEWIESGFLKEGQLFVIGCSTSEVAGEKIGTAGTEDIASILFDELTRLEKEEKIYLAFQGCEHINRSLVVERSAMDAYGLEEVSVVPVPEAGGSMASYAFKNMKDPVVVESLNHKAHAGIDIGETMIGMHLRPVAVPLRFSKKYIGEARIGLARTRPKLIGGNRAHYETTRNQ